MSEDKEGKRSEKQAGGFRVRLDTGSAESRALMAAISALKKDRAKKDRNKEDLGRPITPRRSLLSFK
ncbi:hypothetical protein I5T81_06030 [Stenotrophomonas maltophilia]|nr:hypothetical protein [Stenotrophomonas maltophilia]MBN5104084.1 hypothetical protein [Stenotrophomonas maltophilia]